MPTHERASFYFDVRPKIVAAQQAIRTADYRRAIELYTTAIAISSASTALYLQRAAAKQMMGDFRGAIADCDTPASLLVIERASGLGPD